MANVIEMKCPSCGGQMKLENENKRILKCPYCDCQVMLGEPVNHNYNISNNYINAKNVTVTGKSDSSSLWEKYTKLLKLQDRSSAVKVLDQLLEENPYDVKALKEKIRIADLYFDKGEVLSKFVAGEEIEKIATHYVRTLLDKEFRHMRMLTSDTETLESIRGSYIWAKIEAIHKHSQDKQSDTFSWNDLPTGCFFHLMDSQKRISFDEWGNSERRKFIQYLQNAYQDDYHLDQVLSFMLLRDKQTVIFRVDSWDGDYTSLLAFRIKGRELIAPQSFVHGHFEFKPSLINKRYEFCKIGKPKMLKNPCKISLSHFRDRNIYALNFGDNETVYFSSTESKFEETNNAIKFGWGTNKIPCTFNPWQLS